jgi:DNA polymerase-3 subunit beta
VLLFSQTNNAHQIRLKIAGAELNVSAEDIDFSNKARRRLTCDYQGMICK